MKNSLKPKISIRSEKIVDYKLQIKKIVERRKKPTVSIIMAVKNGMPYLQSAIESILAQTYKDIELIIIDDASTDKTPKVIKSFRDNRIKHSKNKKNLGLAQSLNIALTRTSGDYIARMDADDISLPQRIERQLKYLNDHKSVAICGCWASLIDENKMVISTLKKPTEDWQIKKENKWIPGLIHPTWFAKREVFEKLKGYNPDFDMVEDYEFLLRAKKFKMANLDEILLLWRSPRDRRSHKKINNMYKKSLQLRWQYFRNGSFGPDYIPYLLRSLIATYVFPSRLKIYLNKKAGLI